MIWVCTVCPDLFARKFRIIKVQYYLLDILIHWKLICFSFVTANGRSDNREYVSRSASGCPGRQYLLVDILMFDTDNKTAEIEKKYC